jgi:hypothetical protein
VAAPDVDRINRVNIGLMVGAAAVACTLPFEVFLASYAILGPLHYLTQISWLHDRGYYATSRWDGAMLAALGVVALAAYEGWLPWRGSTLTAFGIGILCVFVRHPVVKVAGLVSLVALTEPLYEWRGVRIISAFLPTVIHVYVFTGLFILAGTLKSPRPSGWASLATYVACGGGLLVVQPASVYTPSAYALANLGPFGSLVDDMAALVPGEGEHPALVAIGRFLAFAYTYHYLNWFSKTEIIRWHEMSRVRMGVIGVLWVLSVALYAYDYAVGLTALFFLSVTHVFLEFPLDVRTLREVLAGGRAAPALRARRRPLV